MERSRRIALGPLIAAAGGGLLVASLFVDWYGGLTAWTAFEVLDLLLAGVALLALLSLADQVGYQVPGVRRGFVLPLGVMALVVVASQLVDHPPAGVGRDLEPGAWMGLAGSALIVAGSALAAARISLAVDVERRVARDAPAAPTAPTRPAAPTGATGERAARTRPADPDASTVAERPEDFTEPRG